MSAKDFVFLLIFFCTCGGILRAQDTRDSLIGDADTYLELRGKVYQSQGQERDVDKKGLDSAEIRVTNETGREVLFGLTDSKGRLAFRLPLGRKFTINISKKGYVKKMIGVDTHVPAEARKVFIFTFDIDIFERIEGLDVSVLNQPVAKVAFRALDKTFSYDAAYTNKVNTGLQKMYREYYALRRKEKAAADSAAGKFQAEPVKKPAGPKKAIPFGQGSKSK